MSAAPEPSAWTEMSEKDLILALQNSLYPGATMSSVQLVLAYCKAAGLDPMTKPVHIVPMWDKNIKAMRDVILPGIELYRTKAARTGQYLGITSIEYGPDATFALGGVTVTACEWIQVTVSRMVAGHIAPFPSGRVYWMECYAPAEKGSSKPNSMWQKRSRGQHEKCAEALALRRGFPEIGAQPTAEEMMGRVLDDDEDAAPAKPLVEMPKPKAVTHDPAEQIPPVVVEQREPVTIEQPKDAGEQKQQAAVPMNAGQLRILTAKAKNAAMNQADLEAQFGEQSSWTASQFATIQAWIAEHSKAA